jgi:hypothetical protein
VYIPDAKELQHSIQVLFADDIKYGKDPTTNIRNQYNLMESGQVPIEDIEIKLTLAKNPDQYPENRLQRLRYNPSPPNLNIF